MSKLRILWTSILPILVVLILSETLSFAAESIADTVDNAVSYIKKVQNSDGGWPLIPGAKSRVDITALAVRTLILADENYSQKQIKDGIAYLLTQQGKDGDWNNSPVDTALALVPIGSDIRLRADIRVRALKWLNKVQNKSGSWSYIAGKQGTLVATSKVVVCLEILRFDQSYTPFEKATNYLGNHANYDGGWAETLGQRSNTLITSWVLHAIASSYDIDEPLAWLKRAQNADYGFGMTRGQSSDPELTAYTIMALVAGEDPLHAERKAIRFLKKSQKTDGSWASDIPSELKTPQSNLQTTCYAIWAIYARKVHKVMAK